MEFASELAAIVRLDAENNEGEIFLSQLEGAN